MKLFKTTSGERNMLTIKSIINLMSVKLLVILIICVLIGFAMGCSADSEIKGEINQ